MNDEYTWEFQNHQYSMPAIWTLLKNGAYTGQYLVKGGRKSPGWYVWYGYIQIARLNPNLTLDEAKDAAKLLLLTHSQS